MLFKFSSKLLLVAISLAFIGMTGCVEEPTIAPIDRPFSVIRVGNMSMNQSSLNVKILDVDRNVVQDLNINRNQLSSYIEVPSGSRRFIAIGTGGDTLYNSAIDITSYSEFTLSFIGYYSSDADENSFTLITRNEGHTYFLNTPGPDRAQINIVHASSATPTDTTAALTITSSYVAPGESSASELEITEALAFGTIASTGALAVQHNFAFLVGSDTVATFTADLGSETINYIYLTGPLNSASLEILIDSHDPLEVRDK